MQFRVLGAVEVRGPDGTWRALGSRSQRRVLAALVANPGVVVGVDALIEAVWDGDPPESALASLRTYLSRLRPLLDGALVAAGAGYRLDLRPDQVDAGRFRALVRDAEGKPPAEALALLEDALALWRGAAFGAEADVPVVRAEARRLDEQHEVVVEARLAVLLAGGKVGEAVAAAEGVLTADPLREAAWVVLVEGLARSGRAAEALRAVQRAGQALAEAGLVASPTLRAVEAAVLDGRLAPDHTPPRALVPDRARVARGLPPPPVSSFVGRTRDRDDVVALLDRARIVTLVGPGGVGKTRLALEVARLAAERRTLGGAVVELAAVDADDAVDPAIRTALGLVDDVGDGAALARAGQLDLLVVLDNAEHVVGGVARAVGQLLSGGEHLRVLVTSRERLGVDGEHVWSVAPLATTDGDGPAARLFVDRARATAPDVPLRVDDEVVQRIVRRLDGLPLAIEMAAGQLASAGPDEVAAVLDEHLEALVSTRRDVAGRHRSLADVLAWSEGLLAPEDAACLADMAVFAGPVAAADVARVLDRPTAATSVRTLVERSLVAIDRRASPPRFHLLQTVRSFAGARSEASGRAAALAERHAQWCLEEARVADATLRTLDERVGHQRLEELHAELRSAHRWARQHRPDVAAALSTHLHLHASTRLLDEPLRWAEELAAELPPAHPAQPVLLASAANRRLVSGDLIGARALAERALALAGDTPAALPALEAAGDAAVYDGRLDDCHAINTAMVRLATLARDPYFLVMGRVGLAMVAAYLGEDPGPDDPFADLDERALSPTSAAWLAYTRGEVLLDRAPGAAFAHFARAVALAHPVGQRMVEGVALVSTCSLQARVGDLDQALATFDEVIAYWLALADRTHLLTTLRNLVGLLERADAPEEVAELLGAVDRDDIPTYGEEAVRLEVSRRWAVGRLGPDRAAAGAARGAQLDIAAAGERARVAVAEVQRRRGASTPDHR